jgi:hypothetical protein
MTEQNEIPTQSTEELEDVEAHGLREVAAAAGIGAAVLGAGGAALAASGSSHVGPAPVMPRVPSVSAASAAAQQNPLVGATTGFVNDVAGPATDYAGAITSYTTDTVNPVVTPVEHTATSTVGATENLATKTVSATENLATTTVTNTTNTVDRELSGVLTPTKIFITSVEGSALKLGGAVADTAGGTAALAVKTAGAAADTAGGTVKYAEDIVALHLQVSVSGQATNPNGTITVTNLNGHTIAQANVENGVATVRIDPRQAATINFHPSTQKLMPSTLHWTPRV